MHALHEGADHTSKYGILRRVNIKEGRRNLNSNNIFLKHFDSNKNTEFKRETELL